MMQPDTAPTITPPSPLSIVNPGPPGPSKRRTASTYAHPNPAPNNNPLLTALFNVSSVSRERSEWRNYPKSIASMVRFRNAMPAVGLVTVSGSKSSESYP